MGVAESIIEISRIVRRAVPVVILLTFVATIVGSGVTYYRMRKSEREQREQREQKVNNASDYY